MWQYIRETWAHIYLPQTGNEQQTKVQIQRKENQTRWTNESYLGYLLKEWVGGYLQEQKQLKKYHGQPQHLRQFMESRKPKLTKQPAGNFSWRVSFPGLFLASAYSMQFNWSLLCPRNLTDLWAFQEAGLIWASSSQLSLSEGIPLSRVGLSASICLERKSPSQFQGFHEAFALSVSWV